MDEIDKLSKKFLNFCEFLKESLHFFKVILKVL